MAVLSLPQKILPARAQEATGGTVMITCMVRLTLTPTTTMLTTRLTVIITGLLAHSVKV